MPPAFLIRPARESDIPEILAIYNRSVATETASFDLEPASLSDRKAWLAAHGGDFPVLVTEIDDTLVGYASLSRYNPKPAYDITAEFSVYVAEDFRRQGVARALSAAILDLARAGNLVTVVSLVTSENAASLELHRELGFREVGVLHRCGRKFGRLLDVTILELDVSAVRRTALP
jgi:phosphinothricin acetyltransferase